MRSSELQIVEQKYLRSNLPDFRVGDTVQVSLRLLESERTVNESDRKRQHHKGKEPVAVFDGVVIRKRGEGTNATFTVYKLAKGVAAERTFFLHSPNILKIEVTRKGKVRRARLYYLRGLSAKKARIKEDMKRAMKGRQKLKSSPIDTKTDAKIDEKEA